MTVVKGILTSTPVHNRHRWVISAGFIWVLSVLLWVLTDDLFPRSDRVQVFLLATVLTSLGLVGAAAMSGEMDLRTALARLKLGPWMAIGFSLGFGVATLAWLGDVKSYHGLVTRSSLAPAGLVAGAGFVALLVAYRWTPLLLRNWGSNVDRVLRGGGAFSPGVLSVWTLWGVAVSAQAVLFARGTFGYLGVAGAGLNSTSSANQVLSGLASLALLATVVAGWRFAGNRLPGSLALLVCIAGSQLLFGLFSGMKGAAVIQLVACVVGYSARDRLKMRALVIAGLVVVFVVTPFVTVYRTLLLSSGASLSPTKALQSVDFVGLISASNAQESDDGSFVDRWSRIGDVAIIMRKTPSAIDYISPRELISGPLLGFVPRSIWPGKPLLDAGYQVNQLYYEMPPQVYSAAAVTPYGDLYRHGGVLIVIAGMTILGMFVRTVDDRAGGSIHADPRLLFLPMLLFTSLVKQEMDYLSLSASFVSVILMATLASRLVSRTTMPTRRDGS